jgi:hypothetical protein
MFMIRYTSILNIKRSCAAADEVGDMFCHSDGKYKVPMIGGAELPPEVILHKISLIVLACKETTNFCCQLIPSIIQEAFQSLSPTR